MLRTSLFSYLARDRARNMPPLNRPGPAQLLTMTSTFFTWRGSEQGKQLNNVFGCHTHFPPKSHTHTHTHTHTHPHTHTHIHTQSHATRTSWNALDSTSAWTTVTLLESPLVSTACTVCVYICVGLCVCFVCMFCVYVCVGVRFFVCVSVYMSVLL